MRLNKCMMHFGAVVHRLVRTGRARNIRAQYSKRSLEVLSFEAVVFAVRPERHSFVHGPSRAPAVDQSVAVQLSNARDVRRIKVTRARQQVLLRVSCPWTTGSDAITKSGKLTLI